MFNQRVGSARHNFVSSQTHIHYFYSTLSIVLGRFARSLALRIRVHGEDKENENVCVFQWVNANADTKKKLFLSLALLFLAAVFFIFGWWMTTCFVSLLEHSTLALLLNTEQWTHTRITQTHTLHTHRRRVGFRHRHFSNRTSRTSLGLRKYGIQATRLGLHIFPEKKNLASLHSYVWNYHSSAIFLESDIEKGKEKIIIKKQILRNSPTHFSITFGFISNWNVLHTPIVA